MTDYERQALHEINIWQQPDTGWAAKISGGINSAMDSAMDLLRKVPGVDWTIDNVVTGLLQLTNEIVQDSIWRDKIYQHFAEAGYPDIQGPGDAQQLTLEEIDPLMQGLFPKYKTLGAAEGAATGAAGMAGIVPDVIGLVAISLRAAGEYAAYCGFDLDDPNERIYALQILDVISRGETAKQVTFSPLFRVTQAVAKRQALNALEHTAVTKLVKDLAKSIGIHVTKAKMAQVVPVAGAVVGGGFNLYYTSKVCDAAYFLYRQRFLEAKYGPVD
ncbi:MAG: hypothetical protein RhofKO_07140 [Rhodothermales bacterium]